MLNRLFSHNKFHRILKYGLIIVLIQSLTGCIVAAAGAGAAGGYYFNEHYKVKVTKKQHS